MAISIGKQFEQIKRDVDNFLDVGVMRIARFAANDLTNIQKSIIRDFYNSYSPNWHDRQYGLRGTGIMQPAVKVAKNTYQAGVMSGSFGMPNPYGFEASKKWKNAISADSVFDLVWNKGIRGLPYGKGSYSFSSNGSFGGISYSGSTPDEAMINAMDNWGRARLPLLIELVF